MLGSVLPLALAPVSLTDESFCLVTVEPAAVQLAGRVLVGASEALRRHRSEHGGHRSRWQVVPYQLVLGWIVSVLAG